MIELSTLVSTIHRILEGQVALEFRLNEAILQSSQKIQNAMEAQISLVCSQIKMLEDLHRNIQNTDSEFKLPSRNAFHLGTSVPTIMSQAHHCITGGADLIKTQTTPTIGISEILVSERNQTQVASELKPIESESNTSQELVHLKALKDEECERQRRELVISRVMSKMNQAEDNTSEDDRQPLDIDSANEWALDTGFDRNRQTRRSLSGFLHYFFGISAPNILIGHKGSRVIHPNSPFVTG